MMTERNVHFIASLNQVYCIKSHFSERIIDLIDNPSFSLVGRELTNLVAQTDLELYHLDQIFYCLNERLSFSNLKALIESLDTLYDNVTDVINVPQLGHIGLFDYLSQLKNKKSLLWFHYIA